MRTSPFFFAAAILLPAAACERPETAAPTGPDLVVMVPGGSIGDRVWIDANGNGVQEAGEAPAVGWAVTLTAPGGVATTRTTGANGGYAFFPLTAGAYRVCVTPRPGFTPTWDADGVSTPNCTAVNLTANRVRTDVDFGYRQVPGELGGRAWNDLNGDGLAGGSEPGLGAWVVKISGAALPAGYASTQSTASTGRYRFTGLPTGTYKVCVQRKAGYTPTYDLNGVSTADCASVPLGIGESRSDADFGYWRPSSIGDRVWDDANGNKVQDAGEAGLAGWTVTLGGTSVPAGYARTQVTGTNGAYRFSGLPAGNYTVCVTKLTGYTQTYDLDGVNTANCAFFTLPAGTNRSDIDFGYRH